MFAAALPLLAKHDSGYLNKVTDEYVKYARQLKDMIARGFSGAIYTQTTDVEIEVNGLMTYDRRVDKVDIPRIREINKQVINTLK